MGIDKARFVNLAIDSKLICGLCQQILSKPIYCKGCASFICKMCSEMFTCENPVKGEKAEKKEDDSFSGEDSIMEDHDIMLESEYSEEQQEQMKMYYDLKVKCVHAGCCRVEALGKVEEHERKCRHSEQRKEKREKQLCSKECGFDNDIGEKLHVKSCGMFPKTCQECTCTMPQKDWEDHSCIQHLLKLNQAILLKNQVSRQEALALDINEIDTKQQFMQDNQKALEQHKQLVKENKQLKQNIQDIQNEFQKQMGRLESSVVPRMRIFQENSQERVNCFEHRQQEHLQQYSKQLLYFQQQLQKDMLKEVNVYHQALQEHKKNILNAQHKARLTATTTPSLKDNFMLNAPKRMKF